MTKSFFVDLSRCTACRGCQLACKQWNMMPFEDTTQTGTYQNPPDLSAKTIRLVRFTEHKVDGQLRWLFFPEQCRHCIIPPCKAVSDSYVEGAITQDDATGWVQHTPLSAKLTEEQRQEVREACPYNIPRWDKADGILRKCTMCWDRVPQGLKPACVAACPTGTMNFGERDEMLALAKARLAEVKKRYPKAMLVNPDDVNVIFLAHVDPKLFYDHLMADAGTPGPLSRKALFAKLAAPLRHLG